MSNAEIRTKMKGADLPIWKVADKLGVCEMTLIRWLRKELSEDKKELVLNAILELSSKGA